MNLDKIKNIHFVGIGGIGMSAIAEILKGRGKTVSGCDLKRSEAMSLLAGPGFRDGTSYPSMGRVRRRARTPLPCDLKAH